MEPFQGDRREHAIVYLCELHNKFNADLGKPLSDCDTVLEDWKILA
jgi:hypothetical protein